MLHSFLRERYAKSATAHLKDHLHVGLLSTWEIFKNPKNPPYEVIEFAFIVRMVLTKVAVSRALRESLWSLTYVAGKNALHRDVSNVRESLWCQACGILVFHDLFYSQVQVFE